MTDQRNGGIAWTDCTWNPIRGCSKVSAGCANCYAESMAARFCGEGMPFHGLIRDGRWSGKIRVVEEKLNDPLRWKKPRRVFVNSMSDLFHHAVPADVIDRIWATMLLGRQHTYQVLTKRPQIMNGYLHERGLYERVLSQANDIRAELPKLTQVGISDPTEFPAKWIHLGVTCENQATIDERIPFLRDTPAAVRFLSVEPLLEKIDLRFVTKRTYRFGDGRAGLSGEIHWVIVGCESGPHRRPCNLDWVHSIVDQCREAGVPVFVKQVEVDGRVTSDVAKFPEWARIRMFPGDTY